MPPARTGVADYSATLLQELRTHGTVMPATVGCDLTVYHIGNNQLHLDAYRRALRIPGIVVLHDAVLHHFYLGSLSEEEYLAEFVYNYGTYAQEEGQSLWRDRSLSAQDPRYFLRPMLRRIVSCARAVVVHNPAAARAVREHNPDAEIYELPHFYRAPEVFSADRIADFRAALGIPWNGFVFAVFGYLRESKRLVPILKAFEHVHRLIPQTRLLIGGSFISSDLERSTADLIGSPGVVRLPHLEDSQFELALASIDCCINLRYPSAGETSGIAIRAMGAARSVVVTDGEEWARFPSETLFRTPIGAGEQDALFETMMVLAYRPELGCQLGRQASLHIQRYHSLTSVASDFWEFLCRHFASSC